MIIWLETEFLLFGSSLILKPAGELLVWLSGVVTTEIGSL